MTTTRGFGISVRFAAASEEATRRTRGIGDARSPSRYRICAREAAG